MDFICQSTKTNYWCLLLGDILNEMKLNHVKILFDKGFGGYIFVLDTTLSRLSGSIIVFGKKKIPAMKEPNRFQLKIRILKKNRFCVRLLDNSSFPEKEVFRFFSNEIPSVMEVINRYQKLFRLAC